MTSRYFKDLYDNAEVSFVMDLDCRRSILALRDSNQAGRQFGYAPRPQVDVVIVGAGSAGLSCAYELTKHPDVRVRELRCEWT